MSRYEKTGLIKHENRSEPNYGDFSQISTYQESMNTIMLAQNMFNELPAQIRKQFENDPELFCAFAENPENKETLIQWGLAEPVPLSSGAGEAEPQNASPTTPKPLNSPPEPKEEASG